MNKILTISVAAYNVASTLDKLMTSVLTAGVNNEVEVLIVNDGSKDNTAELAKKYEKEYPETVRFINKENGGHGSTINRGIQEAKGKYFRALDGDDWVNTSDFGKLVNLLKNVNSDLILTNYVECPEGGSENVIRFNGLENGKEYLFKEAAPIASWMRYHTVIYKTSILQEHHIHLDEHCFYVDTEFMLYPIPYVNTITYYDLDIYCYRLGIGGQSVSPESRMKNIENCSRVSEHLLNFYDNLKDVSPATKNYIAHGITLHLVWYYQSLMFFAPDKTWRKRMMSFDEALKERHPNIYSEMINLDIGSNQKTQKKIKIMRKTHYFAYGIYGILRNIKRTIKHS